MDTRSEKDPFVLYDQRLVERHVRQGYITRSEYDQFLGALADRSDRLERVNFDESLLTSTVRSIDFRLRDADDADETVSDD